LAELGIPGFEGGNWTGPFERAVEPRNDAPRYANPVAVLIGPKIGSSAESFVLMMKHGAGATLFGDVTKGSSGRPLPHQLGNGVTVYLSSWEDQLPDGTILEGRGVRPDVVIKATPFDLEKSDPVLDKALKFLRHRGHDVLVLHIADPAELELGSGEETRFRDPETGLAVTLAPSEWAGAYKETVDGVIRAWGAACRGAGIHYALVTTALPFGAALGRALEAR
jgi:hypothetical protein